MKNKTMITLQRVFLLLILCCTPEIAQFLHTETNTPYSQAQEYIGSFFQESPSEKIAVSALSGGYSEASNFLLEAQSKKYVLRIYKADEVPRKIQKELYAMQEAAKNGIAPHVYAVAKDNHAVLMDFIEGQTATIELAKNPASCRKVADALRSAHTIPQNPHTEECFKERIEQIYDSLRDKELAREAIVLFRKCYDELENMNGRKVNIHGDLNPRNIFITAKGVTFIDWFETRWADPFYDLSCFALFHDYGNQEELVLLENYLQHAPSVEEKRRYYLAKIINLTDFCITGHLFAQHMQLECPRSCDPSTPLQGWSAYVQMFAKNASELQAPFFHEWARASLKYAQQVSSYLSDHF